MEKWLTSSTGIPAICYHGRGPATLQRIKFQEGQDTTRARVDVILDDRELTLSGIQEYELFPLNAFFIFLICIFLSAQNPFFPFTPCFASPGCFYYQLDGIRSRPSFLTPYVRSKMMFFLFSNGKFLSIFLHLTPNNDNHHI